MTAADWWQLHESFCLCRGSSRVDTFRQSFMSRLVVHCCMTKSSNTWQLKNNIRIDLCSGILKQLVLGQGPSRSCNHVAIWGLKDPFPRPLTHLAAGRRPLFLVTWGSPGTPVFLITWQLASSRGCDTREKEQEATVPFVNSSPKESHIGQKRPGPCTTILRIQ